MTKNFQSHNTEEQLKIIIQHMYTIPILITLEVENSVVAQVATMGISEQKSFSTASIFQSQWGICAVHANTIIVAVLANNMFG